MEQARLSNPRNLEGSDGDLILLNRYSSFSAVFGPPLAVWHEAPGSIDGPPRPLHRRRISALFGYGDYAGGRIVNAGFVVSKSFKEMTIIERQEACARLICLLHKMRQDAAGDGNENLVSAVEDMCRSIRAALPLLLERDGSRAADVMKQATMLIVANLDVDGRITDGAIH